jgi:hypothetical protein
MFVPVTCRTQVPVELTNQVHAKRWCKAPAYLKRNTDAAGTAAPHSRESILRGQRHQESVQTLLHVQQSLVWPLSAVARLI